MTNIAKPINNKKPLPATSDNLAIYVPSADQEKLRAVFQCWLEDNALDISSFECKVNAAFDATEANRVIKLAEINPQFKRWFMTGSLEFRVRLKLLEHKSMQALEDVLASDDPKSATAKVNAARYLLELAGKTAKTMPNSAAKLEEAISRMSEAELKMLMENEDGSETTVQVKKTKAKKVIDV